VEQYNLALVQGLLQRSEHVRVEIREHVRAVVRFAKLAGLLCTYAPAERGTAPRFRARYRFCVTPPNTASRWRRSSRPSWPHRAFACKHAACSAANHVHSAARGARQNGPTT
jgi:hypothetical protein